MHSFNTRLQGLHLVQFAVHQIQLWVRLKVTGPFDEIALPGVGREAAERKGEAIESPTAILNSCRVRLRTNLAFVIPAKAGIQGLNGIACGDA
jgi:hypothetical protein